MRKLIEISFNCFLYNDYLFLVRMHHACALQRLHLVQLYLSCLDFNIEAKDCEGNTCLHYVAITGNLKY